MTTFKPRVKGFQLRRLRIFWNILKERQLIWERRRKGQSFPWTKNKILQSMFMTNIYRELDRGTIYWFREIGPAHLQVGGVEQAIFATALYRLCNRQETFETLGFIPEYTEDDNINDWIWRFKKLPSPKFTGAHIQSFVKGMSKEDGYELAIKELAKKCRKPKWVKRVLGKDMREALKALYEITGIGGFIGYEICCDLVYLGITKYGINDWCNPGPGCCRGLNIVFGRQFNDWGHMERVAACKWLQKNQHKLMAKCGVNNFPFWDGKGVQGVSLAGKAGELSLRSIEHSLCEFQKYWRVRNGGHSKNKYHPTGNPVD